MKNLIFFIAFLAVSCHAVKVIPFSRTGAVECVDKDRTTISLVSESFAQNAAQAQEYAVRNAFENLLFKGIPNSNQEKPLAPNEASFKSDHKKTYDALIKDRDYQLFIIDSSVKSSVKSGDGHSTKVLLKIDLQAFRSYLEKAGAIRKFGI